MKILLTGGNGFIGSTLAEKLVKQNFNVRCFVRSTSSLKWISAIDVDFYYGNLLNKDALINALHGVDYVFHLAGTTKAHTEEEYDRGNLGVTKNLIDTILENKIKLKRLVFVSSQAAYGPSDSLNPITENHVRTPLTYYGKSKLKAQQYIEDNSNKIPATIIIPSAVYGPRDTDVLEFFKAVKLGIIPRLGGKDKYASMVHVEDLCDAIIEAAKSEKTIGQSYFIANPLPYPWSKIARITLDIMNKKAIHINIPMPLMKGIALISENISRMTKKPHIVSSQKVIEMAQDYWICSPQKAKTDFGFETKIDLHDGIKNTLAWYVEQKWL